MKITIKKRQTQDQTQSQSQSQEAPDIDNYSMCSNMTSKTKSKSKTTPASASTSTATLNMQIRQKSIEMLSEQLSYLSAQDVQDLEAAVHTEAVSYARGNGTSTHLDNLAFKMLYLGRLRHLVTNLDPTSYIHNTELADNIKNGKLTVCQTLAMTPREMMPSQWVEYEQKETAEIGVITHGELVATTTLFTCSKCKKNKCQYMQLQVRSADEGITNFIRCMTCFHFWTQHN